VASFVPVSTDARITGYSSDQQSSLSEGIFIEAYFRFGKAKPIQLKIQIGCRIISVSLCEAVPDVVSSGDQKGGEMPGTAV